ncbi:MAG: rRNA small subunit methyltransferase B, partial [Pontimonas sp.]
LQRALLRNGLRSLAPGGFLAYVTCSPVVEETTEVVADVLTQTEGFSALDTPDIMGSVARTTLQGHRRGTAAQLWTHRHGTDAMFVQLIRRDH